MFQKVRRLFREYMYGPGGRPAWRGRIACNRIYSARSQALLPPSAGKEQGVVLIDGMWDHPLHWHRVSMVGLALANAHPTCQFLGLADAAMGGRARASLEAIVSGGSVIDVLQNRRFKAAAGKAAQPIIEQMRLDPNTLLNAALPGGVPGSRLYDIILKRQRRAEVDPHDAAILRWVAEFIETTLSTENILAQHPIKAIVSSHTVSFRHASLAWLGIREAIPVYVMDNYNGNTRIKKLLHEDDFINPIDCPHPEDLAGLDASAHQRLVDLGHAVLHERRSAKSIDMGGQIAYAQQSGSTELLPTTVPHDKPVVVVMLSNWFDFPHTFGLTNFTSILDWFQSTLVAIRELKHVHWLLKPHPAESRWYGGPTLDQVIDQPLPDHITLFPSSVNPADTVDQIDGIVTPHGTAGIEYAAAGKSVLLADQTFYSDWSFCLTPDSREAYFEMLSRFPLTPPENASRQAEQFTGLYLGIPPNADPSYLYPCDAHSYELLPSLPEFMESNGAAIEAEIDFLKTWMASSSKAYHTFKTLDAITG